MRWYKKEIEKEKKCEISLFTSIYTLTHYLYSYYYKSVEGGYG